MRKRTIIEKGVDSLTVTVEVNDNINFTTESHEYCFPTKIFPPEVAMQIATAIASVNSYLLADKVGTDKTEK